MSLLRKAWLAKADTPRDQQSRMWAMQGLAVFARNSGQFDEATRAALECQALAQELGDVVGESFALGCLSYIALAQGDYDRTDALTRLAIEKRELSSEGWAVTEVLVHLGAGRNGPGNLISARVHFEEVVASELQHGTCRTAARQPA